MTSPAATDTGSSDAPDLAAQLESIVAAAEQIVATAQAAGRELTADEDRQHAELTTRAERVGEQITRARTLDRIRGAAGGGNGLIVERGTPGGGSGNGWDRDPFADPRDSERRGGGRDPWAGDIVTWSRNARQVSAEYTARARAAIEQMPGATDAVRESATLMLERHDDRSATMARFTLATSRPAYLRAFAELAVNPMGAGELDDAERHAIAEVRDLARALSLMDSASGFLVPFQLDPTVIISANGSRNDIRKAARQVVATSDVWHGVSAGAVNWSWDAEETEASDDSPSFAQPEIPIFKAQGFVPVSVEAIQDAQNITAEIGRLLAFGRETLESAAFAIGTGVGQPTGIVTALAGSSSVISSQDTDIMQLSDVYRLHDSLSARYRAAGSWLASNSFYSRTRQFDEGGGNGLWAQIGADRPAQLLGKPVYEAEDMDSSITGSAENYMAVFGDFSEYVIADRLGVTVELIPTIFGPNGRPTGQRGWHAYYRTGAAATTRAAFRLLNVT